MKKLEFFSAVVLQVAISVLSTHAAIIHVPSGQPTIQAGIDVSFNADTVLLGPGIYIGVGNFEIDFKGKSILLKSSQGADVTVIDGQGKHAMTVQGGHTAAVLLFLYFLISNGELVPHRRTHVLNLQRFVLEGVMRDEREYE